MSWVESVRREICSTGIESWDNFVRRGNVGELTPDRLLMEWALIKQQRLKIWDVGSIAIRRKVDHDRFQSKKCLRRETFVIEAVVRENEKWHKF